MILMQIVFCARFWVVGKVLVGLICCQDMWRGFIRNMLEVNARHSDMNYWFCYKLMGGNKW